MATNLGFFLGGAAEGIETGRKLRQADEQLALREQALKSDIDLRKQGLGLQERRLAQSAAQADRRFSLDERRLGLQERQIADQQRRAVMAEVDKQIANTTGIIGKVVESGLAAGRDREQIAKAVKPLLDSITGLATRAGRNPQIYANQVEAMLSSPGGVEMAAQSGRVSAAEKEAQITALAESAGLDPQAALRSSLTSDGGTDFGRGVTGRSLALMSDFAPAFASGELTPEQERAFIAAVTEYRQPKQFRDPDTGLMQTRRNEVPSFVRDAFDARGMTLPGGDATVAPADAALDLGGTSGSSSPTKPTPETAETPEQVEAAKFPTLPEDAVIPDPSTAMPEEGAGGTLLHEVQSGNVTGPVPIFGRLAARIPGLGVNAPEMTQAGTMFPLMRNRLIKALQTNPRFAVAERQDIMKDIDIDPKVFDSPQAFTERLIGVDRALESIENEVRDVVTGSRSLVSGETRQHALDTLQSVQNFRKIMMPPRMKSRQEAEEFVKSNPSGTQFVAQDDDGSWKIFEVQ